MAASDAEYKEFFKNSISGPWKMEMLGLNPQTGTVTHICSNTLEELTTLVTLCKRAGFQYVFDRPGENNAMRITAVPLTGQMRVYELPPTLWAKQILSDVLDSADQYFQIERRDLFNVTIEQVLEAAKLKGLTLVRIEDLADVNAYMLHCTSLQQRSRPLALAQALLASPTDLIGQGGDARPCLVQTLIMAVITLVTVGLYVASALWSTEPNPT